MFHVEMLLLSKLLTQSVVKFIPSAFILGFFLLVGEDMVRLIRRGGGGLLRDGSRGGGLLRDGSRGGGILLIFYINKKKWFFF